MSADFSRAAAVLGAYLAEHADRDGLLGVKRAVFMDRGGHAPGEVCPSAGGDQPQRELCNVGVGPLGAPLYRCTRSNGHDGEHRAAGLR